MQINDPQCSRACNTHYVYTPPDSVSYSPPAMPTLPLPEAPRVTVPIPGPSVTVGLVTWSLSGSCTGPNTGSPWTVGLSDRWHLTCRAGLSASLKTSPAWLTPRVRLLAVTGSAVGPHSARPRSRRTGRRRSPPGSSRNLIGHFLTGGVSLEVTATSIVQLGGGAEARIDLSVTAEAGSGSAVGGCPCRGGGQSWRTTLARSRVRRRESVPAGMRRTTLPGTVR